MDIMTRTRFTLVALCLAIGVQAQMESRLSFRRYTTQDGLPQMQCERIFQDARGYIYVGTLSGFVRFDGREFSPFLKGRRFNIVGFAEADGQVWAYDFRRKWLVGLDEAEMSWLTPDHHWLLNNYNSGLLPSGYVLLEDEREANRRLCRVNRNGFQTVLKGALLDQMTPDRRLTIDTTGLFVPTAQGLFRVLGSKATRLTRKGDIFSVCRSGTAMLLFAADGIYSADLDTAVSGRMPVFRKRTATQWSGTYYGLIVRTLANGHLVVADEHTVYEYDGRHIRPIATGLNMVKDVLVDCWNRLWVATYEGLYCYFNLSFTTHRLTDGDDIVRAIGITKGDSIVMGTLNGKVLTPQGIVYDDPQQFFSSSAATINNKVYMAGGGDVMCYDGTCRWLQLPHDRYQFVAAADGRLIVGSRKYIAAYDPVSEQLDTLSTDIPYPWCAAQDAQGRLWGGTTFGLYVDGRKYGASSEDDGGRTLHLEGERLIVTTMERDQQGNILLASKDSLFVIRDGQLSPVVMPELAGHEVRSLHVSPKGFLVVAVIDGLFVSRIHQDYSLSDIRFFNHRNGFTMLEPLQATMAETSDGTVWLAGIEQTTSFRPADLYAYSEEDTYISPPLRWWQHWWVWLSGLLLMALAVWAATRWHEKRRNRRKMIRLQGEKLQKEQQIEAIRQKAIKAEPTALAQDIVKMTERTADERMTFRTASGTLVVDVSDIAFFKGDGNYSQIVTFHDKDTVLIGLGALEKTLNPEIFVRADRSTLVNIHNIAHLQPKQRLCVFRSAKGQEVQTTLLAPAFKRLQAML